MKTLPVIQQALEARMRAASAAGDNATRASIASAQLGQRAMESDNETAVRSAEIGARVQMQQAQMQQQWAMQQAAQQADAMQQEQAVQNRMRLMEAEVPQQLQMQQQQLQSAKASAYESYSKGEIDLPTFQAVLAKAHGVGDPIQRKLAESQLIQEQAQAQRAQQQAAMIANLTNTQRANDLGFWHKTANQLAGNPDPQPGAIQAIPVVDRDGNVLGHQVLSPEGKTTWAQKEQTIRGLSAQDFSTLYMKAQEAGMKRHTTKDEITGEEKVDVDAGVKAGDELFERMLANVDKQVAQRKPGYKPPSQPTVDPAAQQQELARQGVAAGRGLLFGGSGVSRADAPVQGMEGPPPSEAAARPYTLEKPVTPAQIQAVDTFKALDQRLKAALKPGDPEYSRIAGFIRAMADIHQKTGGIARMNEAERRWYDANRRQVNEEFRKLSLPKPAAPIDTGPGFATPAGF